MSHEHGYIQEKQRYLARLKRIEGQIRGIHRMIDEDQYCIDILTQISAPGMVAVLRGAPLRRSDTRGTGPATRGDHGGPEGF